MPGRPPEDLLEIISFSRADGREVSLAEFPIAQYLGIGETVRAEEVTLSVPDGRSGQDADQRDADPCRGRHGGVGGGDHAGPGAPR